MQKLIPILFFLTLFTQNTFAQLQAHHLSKNEKVEIAVDYPYLLSIPEAEEKQLPLLVFLHGAGERGNNTDLLKVHGPPKLVEQGKDLPFIILAPQCKEGDQWNPYALNVLIDEIIAKYPVDERRIYLTGLSMGGFGTWDLAIAFPNKFAAIAPICGGSPWHSFQAAKIKHLPIWVFHGAMDNVISIEGSIAIVRTLKHLGADVQFTVYPDANHDSWTATYDNRGLYDWFLSHIKKE